MYWLNVCSRFFYWKLQSLFLIRHRIFYSTMIRFNKSQIDHLKKQHWWYSGWDIHFMMTASFFLSTVFQFSWVLSMAHWSFSVWMLFVLCKFNSFSCAFFPLPPFPFRFFFFSSHSVVFRSSFLNCSGVWISWRNWMIRKWRIEHVYKIPWANRQSWSTKQLYNKLMPAHEMRYSTKIERKERTFCWTSKHSSFPHRHEPN